MADMEALYIYDEHNHIIIEHIYTGRPPSAGILLHQYLLVAPALQSVVHLPGISPPTTCYSILQDRLLFLAPCSMDTEPLLVIEFLHRVADALEDFLGSPLLASKIENNYDVVAQLLSEMCDAGLACNTEPNSLRELVEAPNWVGKLLSGVALPGASPALGTSGSLQKPAFGPPPSTTAAGSAIPWRRANVRHTSNELYVDIVEKLEVILAPSGRPLSAIVHGTIAFNSKISGVPDLLLRLSAPGGDFGMDKIMELPVFHPCVRLARWKERPGELSFVPPDGRFVLAGYQTNLLPDGPFSGSTSKNISPPLNLPASVEVMTSLGPNGTDFEVRLHLSRNISTTQTTSSRGAGRLGTSSPAFGNSTSSSSSTPLLEDLTVTIPLPPSVRNVSALRPSKGEAHFTPTATGGIVEWRIASRDSGATTTATLRCTVTGPLGAQTDNEDTNGFSSFPATSTYDYNDDVEPPSAYQSSGSQIEGQQKSSANSNNNNISSSTRQQRTNAASSLMPTTASVSFALKGWLASGIRVERLSLEKASKGIGAGVTPYKGVKYITVSRQGIETRV